MRDRADAPDLRVRGVRRVNRNGRLCVFCVSRKEDAMTPRQPHPRRRVPAYTAVVLAFLALVGSLGLTTAASASAAPYCGITWGSLTKAGGVETAPNLTGVRTGRHDCYDRLVLDLRGGSSAGFHVSYVDAVYTDASGAPRPVARRGSAPDRRPRLQLRRQRARRPTSPPTRASWPTSPGTGPSARWPYAGSFEGQTTVGLGVRARLPFRAFTLAGPVRLPPGRGRRPPLVSRWVRGKELLDTGFTQAGDDFLSISRQGGGTPTAPPRWWSP